MVYGYMQNPKLDFLLFVRDGLLDTGLTYKIFRLKFFILNEISKAVSKNTNSAP